MLHCTQCGHPLDPDALFCDQCGKSAPQAASGMTNFTRIRELFESAMAQRAERREAWLRDACGRDESLFMELRAMVSAAGSTIISEAPAGPPAAPLSPPPVPPPAPPPSGRYIGPYKLLRELGRGGMGVVYLAVRDDGAFRKNVAIKLLMQDKVTPEFVLRFKQERQVLAALDHPNIARILDGGDAPDGTPFYVME